MPEPTRREVEVPLRRLRRWLTGFAERHGPWSADRDLRPDGWLLTARDGTTAWVADPTWLPYVADGVPFPDLADLRPRFGVLLLRRAGYAVAAFDGACVLDRKVGTRHIHGRTAAGGWSQQRYARRRANQSDEIVTAAVQHAERILGGLPDVRFLATGGDRPLLTAARRALSPRTAGLPVGAHLGIGTPDAEVLAGCPDRILAVRITVEDA